MKVIALTLCLCIVVNLLEPALRQGFAGQQVYGSGGGGSNGPNLSPISNPDNELCQSLNLTDALNLLLEDLTLHEKEQSPNSSGSSSGAADRIHLRLKEIETHYDRICDQLTFDMSKVASNSKKALIKETQARLEREMGWLKSQVAVLLSTQRNNAIHQTALNELKGKVKSLQSEKAVPQSQLAHGTMPKKEGPSGSAGGAAKGVNNVRNDGATGGPFSGAGLQEFAVTQELIDLVNRLDRDPLKIYQFLRNHCDYEPYTGFMKGPHQTLLEMSGNDADLASLLVVLLKTAGYQARYAKGRIFLTMQQAMDWVGTRDPQLAASFFIKNGIDAQFIMTGETYSGVSMDHWWVQAFVPYLPGQGALRAQPDSS